MIVDIGQRELEIMVLNEVIVGRIAIRQHVIHLVVKRTVADLGAVGPALHPDGTGPLEEPRTRVDIARKRNPQVVNAELVGLVPHVIEQDDPLFPQVGGMIETAGATVHMVMVLVVTHNAVALGKCAILRVIGKAVPLPVVDMIVGHPLKRHLLELVHIALVGNVDGTAGLGAVTCRRNDACELTIEVVATARADPHAKV